MLTALGLGDRLSHRPTELSGGEDQRVAIARALVGGPQVILADEPTGNLDSQTSEEIMGVLAKLNQMGKTIVMITHDREVAQCGRRLVSFRDGEIQGTQPIEAPRDPEGQDEVRGQQSEVRGQRSAVRGQRSGSRDQGAGPPFLMLR